MAKTRQYADRVNIIKMVKVNGKWPFAGIVERNGKIVRDHVCVDGRDEHHPEGRYYLEWYEKGKRRRLECPASFVPVDLRETGMRGALNGTRKEAYA
jgi:hypothetical protein